MAKSGIKFSTPAAPAAPAGHPTPCGQWDVDDAFRYLTHVLGKQGDDLALYKLTESLLTGQLQMHVEHFVAGELKGAGIVQANWWRDQLILGIVNNHAAVKPLKAFVPGEFRYTLRESDVRLLWAPDDADPIIEALLRAYPPDGRPPGFPKNEKVVLGKVNDELVKDGHKKTSRTTLRRRLLPDE